MNVSPMVGKNIKDYKDALETRIRTYKELTKRERWITYCGTFLMVSSTLLFFVLAFVFWWLPVIIAGYAMLILMVIGSTMVFTAQHLTEIKGVPRFQRLWLNCDERIFLKIFDALVFLGNYLQQKLGPAKYQCLKTLLQVHALMQEYWTPSEIKVVMKEIGSEIETFKEKFEKNLIFTLEKGIKTETVHGVYDILTEFATYLIEPDKERLVDLNKKMDSLLHSDITRPRYPIVAFLKRYKVHQHVAVLGAVLAIGFFSAYLGIYYKQISMDTAFVVFATIFGPLAAVYLSYVLRRE